MGLPTDLMTVRRIVPTVRRIVPTVRRIVPTVRRIVPTVRRIVRESHLGPLIPDCQRIPGPLRILRLHLVLRLHLGICSGRLSDLTVVPVDFHQVRRFRMIRQTSPGTGFVRILTAGFRRIRHLFPVDPNLFVLSPAAGDFLPADLDHPIDFPGYRFGLGPPLGFYPAWSCFVVRRLIPGCLRICVAIANRRTIANRLVACRPDFDWRENFLDRLSCRDLSHCPVGLIGKILWAAGWGSPDRDLAADLSACAASLFFSKSFCWPGCCEFASPESFPGCSLFPEPSEEL